MKIRKSVWLNIIGIFLVVLGLVRIIQLLFFGVPVHVFWICNHILVFMGIAILFRNTFWLIAEFIFLFVGQFIWVIAFVMYFFFGVIVPGTSTHLIYDSQFINIISLIVHFWTLPLGFIAILILNKQEKFAWKGALLHTAILFPFVIYFGSQYNLNCFFKPCLDFIPNVSLYPLFIFLFYFLVFVIPLNYLVNWIIKKSSKR